MPAFTRPGPPLDPAALRGATIVEIPITSEVPFIAAVEEGCGSSPPTIGSGTASCTWAGSAASAPTSLVEAFAGLPHRLVVVGEGPLAPHLDAIASPNVTFRRSVTDDELRDLYRSARGLVYPVDEDFGIVMAEAQACGTPVIGLAGGRALEIVSHGRTGWLIREQTAAEVRRAVAQAAAPALDGAAVRASAERFFRERFRAGFAASVEDMIRDPRRA